ncbi:phage repressor protein CI [Candidatus Arsenophonus triatominarum]|uniref:phage repressor protein CI n=1 Tax=Candidatus Arsenophonus triatominarum TaxID=57911 RepID=UPI0007C5CC45|nr:phage repressor protein CI [Candidatus Arsenophonus triatominarum]
MAKFEFNPDVDAGEVLDRIVEAYGFNSKLMLAVHFNMAASSLSSRYKRGIFPADMVICCVAETGVNLEWLVSGQGKKFDDSILDTLEIENYKLVDRQICELGHVMIDKRMFPKNNPLPNDLISVINNEKHLIVNREFSDVFDGKWLVDIEGKISFRDLTLIPIKRVRVSGVGMAFDCDISDIHVIGRVIGEFMING